ncbi:hypothetical protein [Parabacteroides bouchesdurhonensis]|uniref:hypothetical protein n=1 Tax=Parabacteroides bouchesdurhonensis TaxID=1936995 RepID=UPI000C857571|nr:hypothetical protein [Parabacteroides bouchesdurhonensis]
MNKLTHWLNHPALRKESTLFWTWTASAVLFVIPMLYTPGADYVVSQYVQWFKRLGDDPPGLQTEKIPIFAQ